MTAKGMARVGSHGPFTQSELNALNVDYGFCTGAGEQRTAQQGLQGCAAPCDSWGALAQPKLEYSDWECSSPSAPQEHTAPKQPRASPATALEAVLHHSELRNAERRQTGFQRRDQPQSPGQPGWVCPACPRARDQSPSRDHDMKRHLPALAAEFTCHDEETQKCKLFHSLTCRDEVRLLPGHLAPATTHQHSSHSSASTESRWDRAQDRFSRERWKPHIILKHTAAGQEGTATGESGLLPRRGCVATLHKWSQKAFALLSRALGESLVEAYPHGWSHTDCNKELIA